MSPEVIYIPSPPPTTAEPVLWVPIRNTEVTECELRAALKEVES